MSQFFSDSGRIIYYIKRLGICLIYQGAIVLAVSLVYKYLPNRSERLNRPGLAFPQSLKFFTSPAGVFSLALGISFFLYQPGIKEFFFKDDFWHMACSGAESWRDVLNFFNPERVGHNYRPISIHLYFFILRKLFGLEPQGYHISKILVHAINTALLFVLADRLTKNKFLAIISAFLFLTRISHFDSVFWTSTEDPIASIFMLLSIIAYLKREPADPAVSFSSIIYFALALMSKEAAVVLPLLLLAYEFLVQGDIRSRLGTAGLKLLPYFTLLFMYLWMQWHYNIISGGPHKLHLGLHMLNNILVYLRFTFNGPFDPLPAFILIFAAFMRPSTWINWGISWYAISLLPVIFIDRVTLQYMYIPSMGICLSFGVMIDYLYNQIEMKHKLAGIGLAAFLLAAGFSNTVSRLKHEFSTYFKIDYCRVSKNYLEDLQRLHSAFPEGSTLYFIPRPPATIDYYCKITADSSLFNVFYFRISPPFSIKFCVREGDTPRPITLEDVPRPLKPNIYVFEFDMRHIHEITDTI